ncbi:hypothetical protein HD554DRAFT_2107700 [Boletus coccyginus]|nr:hypothetical protein HD554DRAFT_2107700 [Boletus coccyginus]
MVSIHPQSDPPSYTDAVSSFIPPVSMMDPNNHPFALPHPMTCTVTSFCKALHRARSFSSQHGIVSVQHRKRTLEGLQHESLILDVVPLIPGGNWPQRDPLHTYIEVGRLKDPDHACLVWGVAKDKVTILGQEKRAVHAKSGPEDRSARQTPSIRTTFEGISLFTLSWARDLPNLIDVFEIIRLLSLTHPHYNIFSRQCFWFARAIFRILRSTYEFVEEATGDKAWKMGKFLIFFRVLTPSPSARLVSFAQDKSEWNRLARERQTGCGGGDAHENTS